MVSQLDYAVLSAAVYNNARGEFNLIDELPSDGWSSIDYIPGGGLNGFTAEAYKNGSDIVIAFKGTDTTLNNVINIAGTVGDAGADLLLGAGVGSTQLFQAALFYEQIKAANPGANITFTGHSLGGGLASIMSVWFNRQATTFDEAPFEVSALNPLLMTAVSAYLGLNGYADTEFLSFIFSYPVTYSARQAQVTNHFVDGEVLEALRAAWPTVLGSDNQIEIGGASSLSSVTLHSINLLAALKMQDKLRTDTLALPNLLPAIFDQNLYARPLEKDPRDFLTFLLNDQITKGYTNADGLLARFSSDVEKLAQGGAILNDGINKALIAAAIEDYYFMESGFTHDFFQTLTNGISFDLKDIGADWNSPDMKALRLLTAATQQLVGAQAGRYLAGLQPNKWYVQAGLGGMTASDTGGDNVAMLGGALDDQLTSGGGNDFLYGGAGADTYIFAPGAGLDTIADSDGQGSLQYAGATQNGAEALKYGDGLWRDDTNELRYALLGEPGAQTLIVSGADSTLRIDNWSDSQLGISLTTDAVESDPLPDYTEPLGGLQATEFQPAPHLVRDFAAAGIGPIRFTLPDNDDDGEFRGEGGNDVLITRGGNDRLYGGDGDDALQGGDDHDYLQGDAGNDLLAGGLGADMLDGGAGQWEDDYGSLHLKVILTSHHGNNYRSSCEPKSANTEWRLAA